MQAFKREYQKYEKVARFLAIEDKKELATLQECLNSHNEECGTHLVGDEDYQREYQEEYGNGPVYDDDDFIPIKKTAFEYRQDAAARFEEWYEREALGPPFNGLSCFATMELTYRCGAPKWMPPRSLETLRNRIKENGDAEHVGQYVEDHFMSSDYWFVTAARCAVLRQKMREFTIDIARRRVMKAAQKITGVASFTTVDEAARAVYQKLAIRVARKGFKMPHVLTKELAGYVGVTVA